MRISLKSILLWVAILVSADVHAATGSTLQEEINRAASEACRFDQLNPTTMAHIYMGAGTPLPALAQRSASSWLEFGNGGRIAGYTRIRIAYQPCDKDQRDIGAERRTWLDRYFLGKHAEKLLTIDAHVTPLDVKTTRTLASIVRDSSKKGEVWSTQVDNDGILLPYFRIDHSTIVDVDVKLHSTREYNSSVAASSLDIVQRAASLISPTTPLITAANKDRFNDSATFVDTAVNGLLKVDIDEEVRSRVPLMLPDRGQILAVIALHLPRANDTYVSMKSPAHAVGQWVVYTEPETPSMLGPIGANGAISRKQITAAAILNYLVDDKKTLREALSGVQSLVTARDALVKATADKDVTDNARSLCRIVTNESLSLGLAPVDAGASAWAYLTDLAFSDTKMNKSEMGCHSVEFYPPSD